MQWWRSAQNCPGLGGGRTLCWSSSAMPLPHIALPSPWRFLHDRVAITRRRRHSSLTPPSLFVSLVACSAITRVPLQAAPPEPLDPLVDCVHSRGEDRTRHTWKLGVDEPGRGWRSSREAAGGAESGAGERSRSGGGSSGEGRRRRQTSVRGNWARFSPSGGPFIWTR
jgi:hypothetical protein